MNLSRDRYVITEPPRQREAFALTQLLVVAKIAILAAFTSAHTASSGAKLLCDYGSGCCERPKT
jgi:hypothetical protein